LDFALRLAFVLVLAAGAFIEAFAAGAVDFAATLVAGATGLAEATNGLARRARPATAEIRERMVFLLCFPRDSRMLICRAFVVPPCCSSLGRSEVFLSWR
jgi:hypothetical protein